MNWSDNVPNVAGGLKRTTGGISLIALGGMAIETSG